MFSLWIAVLNYLVTDRYFDNIGAKAVFCPSKAGQMIL